MKWLFLIMVISMVYHGNAATTWYVTKSGDDTNSGKSESSAFLTIQKAINKSVAGDTILVADGTYAPINVPPELDPLTIQAVGATDKCIISGGGTTRCVTLGSEAAKNICLIGFTITNGYIGGGHAAGAGVLYGTLKQCVITGNRTGSVSSGAVAGKCTLINCTISNNNAEDWVGGLEGCVATNCVISGNKSSGVGAGGASGSTLVQCKIIGNSSGSSGGGVNDCTLYGCVLDSNSTGSSNAGSEISGGSIARSCLIVANGGAHCIVGSTCYNCTIVSSLSHQNIWRATTLCNCIISRVSGNGTFSAGGDNNWNVKLKNCVLNNITDAGYLAKENCVTKNPKFLSMSDFHLQSDSPCINAGDNSYVEEMLDLDGEHRIVNGVVDVGAYEWQAPKAEVKSVTACPRYPWNGLVDLKFTIDGTSGTKYDTSFTAKDIVGNTNLTMKTLYKSDGTAANVAKEQLLPGTYNWVWDATADLGEGTVLDRVTISINVQ